MGTREITNWLIGFWQFGWANITDLAKYCMVSRDTVYRWLNRKSLPKEIKAVLIEEWLKKHESKEGKVHREKLQLG